MMTPEAIEAISKAKHDLVSAKARNSGVMAAKEKMKNLLFNYHDDIVKMAMEFQNLQDEVSVLEGALEESDLENNELRKELKELKAQKGNIVNAPAE